jgi:hypothetical protein
LEYTIISDAVNTAQRIEELCKEIGWDLLISEQTYQMVADEVEVGAPWRFRLRGHTRDTLVYPLLGRRGDVASERREAHEQMIARARPAAGKPARRATDVRPERRSPAQQRVEGPTPGRRASDVRPATD